MIRYLNQPGHHCPKSIHLLDMIIFQRWLLFLSIYEQKSCQTIELYCCEDGGDRSLQYAIFKVAFASFKMSFNKNVDIQIKYLGPKEIGERRWNPRQLVDWQRNVFQYLLTPAR